MVKNLKQTISIHLFSLYLFSKTIIQIKGARSGKKVVCPFPDIPNHNLMELKLHN